jgi:MFS transporter, DHA2 family, multidrug resistance protein
MGEHITPDSPAAQNALESAKAAFLASGADAATATQRAYAAVFGTVQRHATMVAFVDLFRFLGMIFLLLLPLVMLMRRPRGRAAAAAH